MKIGVGRLHRIGMHVLQPRNRGMFLARRTRFPEGDVFRLWLGIVIVVIMIKA